MTVKLSDFKAMHDNRHNVINVGCPWCEIGELKAAQEWVSVSERFPVNDGQLVLVAYPYGSVETTSARWVCLYPHNYHHWMPLPLAPQDASTGGE